MPCSWSCTRWRGPPPNFHWKKKHIFNTATRVRDACPPIFVRVELADLTRAVPSRALAKFAVWPYFNTSELHCSRGLAVPMFSELSMWERPVPQFPLEKRHLQYSDPVLELCMWERPAPNLHWKERHLHYSDPCARGPPPNLLRF